MSRPAAAAPERVVVVGAGIGGLAAAHRVHRLLPGAVITVLDADERTGGKIRTTPFAGLPAVDCGADAFLARSPAAVGLARELGLGDQLTTPAARTASVYLDGALRPFPTGLVLGVPTDLDALAASGLISAAGVARAGEDLTLPDNRPALPADHQGDESVGGLVRRRVGDEVYETLVAPLLSGVNGGDADHLSCAAGAPQLAAAVADQPSLIAGLRAQAEAARATNPDPDAPVFYALLGGSQTLTDALAAALPAGAVHVATAATAVEPRAGGGARVHTTAGPLDADAVVIATPSTVTATLLASFAPGAAEGLAALKWAPAALVTLAVPASALPRPLEGSGFLVAEREGLLLTACSFGSNKWAHWRPDGQVILRAGAGRFHDRRMLDLPDDELVDALVADLATTIGLTGRPTEVRVARWAEGLPQYRPGHLVRARSWKDEVAAAAPGIALTGASYFGLGIPAIITDADAEARALAGPPDAGGGA